MSIAATIKKKGMLAYWRPMSGSGGEYDFVTRTVKNAPSVATQEIYIVADGFGSVTSTLRSMFMEENALITGGDLRIYTVTNIKSGDIVNIDDEDYVAIFGKMIKKGKETLYIVAVKK